MRVRAVILALAATLAASPARAENVLRWASTTEAAHLRPPRRLPRPDHRREPSGLRGAGRPQRPLRARALARDGLAPPRSPHLGVRAAPGRHLPRRRAVHAPRTSSSAWDGPPQASRSSRASCSRSRRWRPSVTTPSGSGPRHPAPTCRRGCRTSSSCRGAGLSGMVPPQRHPTTTPRSRTPSGTPMAPARSGSKASSPASAAS